MANISWTSTSINNFFNSSLGNPSYTFGNLYSSLGNASLIKSGTYKRLMDSYYSSVVNSKEESSNKTDTSTTDTSKKENVLDKLLSKDSNGAKIKNTVLDDLLNDDKKDGTVTEVSKPNASVSTAYTYNSDATKSAATTASVLDESI